MLNGKARELQTHQVLHCIRHGESEYNAATQYSKGFEDPQIFNPRLTERGRKQVGALRTMLMIILHHSKSQLWPIAGGKAGDADRKAEDPARRAVGDLAADAGHGNDATCLSGILPCARHQQAPASGHTQACRPSASCTAS